MPYLWEAHRRPARICALVDVRAGAVEPVPELPPLRRVDVQALQVGSRDPADVAGHVIAGGRA